MSRYTEQSKLTVQNSKTQESESNHDNINNNLKLRKMLSTAALSVALISWYTTANGLHQYVFDNTWQAYIISAALQGVLFSLSIKGIPILLQFKIAKKIFLILVWGCLLGASSIFSYVYISKDVYSDRLLQEDVHRIFSTYCLSQNYWLSDQADKLLNGSSDDRGGIINDMNSYIQTLASLEDGVNLSEGNNDKKIEKIKKSILPYAYIHNEHNGKIQKNAIIKECIDTSDLVSKLNIILNQKYVEQAMSDAKVESDTLIEAIETRKTRKESEKKSKEKERGEYQERLKTFSNTDSNAYKDTKRQLENVIKEINKIEKITSALEEELSKVNRVLNVLDSVDKSMASFLYNEVLNIRSKMNKKEIDVKAVRKSAESLYDILLENSATIAASDSRLTKYPDFKSNLSKYASVVKAKKLINVEIKSLYNLESIDKLNFEFSDAGQKTASTGSNADNDITTSEDGWKNYWQAHLNSLKKSAKKMQAGGLDTELITELLETIENYERLYLSDLNDFELAWELLFGSNPKHPYTALLKFSFIFSFGIDTFSVFISCLLYLFKPQKNN